MRVINWIVGQSHRKYSPTCTLKSPPCCPKEGRCVSLLLTEIQSDGKHTRGKTSSIPKAMHDKMPNERERQEPGAGHGISGNNRDVLWRTELRTRPRAAPSVHEGFVGKAELEDDRLFQALLKLLLTCHLLSGSLSRAISVARGGAVCFLPLPATSGLSFLDGSLAQSFSPWKKICGWRREKKIHLYFFNL